MVSNCLVNISQKMRDFSEGQCSEHPCGDRCFRGRLGPARDRQGLTLQNACSPRCAKRGGLRCFASLLYLSMVGWSVPVAGPAPLDSRRARATRFRVVVPSTAPPARSVVLRGPLKQHHRERGTIHLHACSPECCTSKLHNPLPAPRRLRPNLIDRVSTSRHGRWKSRCSFELDRAGLPIAGQPLVVAPRSIGRTAFTSPPSSKRTSQRCGWRATSATGTRWPRGPFGAKQVSERSSVLQPHLSRDQFSPSECGATCRESVRTRTPSRRKAT